MKPKVGLLPLYLKLYDDTMPQLREEFDRFLSGLVKRLELHNLEVEIAQVCRIHAEVATAVRRFESVHVDLVITVHLAYSPSLESADILAKSSLPLLMLDTTMDYEFSQHTDPARLMFNHGVHGVQDLASVLRRMSKRFVIVAGHADDVEMFERTARFARGAAAARQLRTTKALRIGETFKGMGDFAVDDELLRERLGIQVTQIGIEPLEKAARSVKADDIEEEIRRDKETYEVTAPDEVHRRSVRVGLALRAVLDTGQFNAFSMNFLLFNSGDGPLDTVPFLEASKAMSRGIGYAGEGDVLTASLIGALQRSIGTTTFTEIFCPHWKQGGLFISHMGEVNPLVSADKPLLCEKDFPWTGARNPSILACAPRNGPAVLVNLAPGPENTFGAILAQVDVNPDAKGSAFKEWVRGWLTPRTPLPQFLESYSLAGGTHHCALVLGDVMDELHAFAMCLGAACDTIGTCCKKGMPYVL